MIETVTNSKFQKIKEKLAEHKTELIFAGSAIVATVVAIVFVKKTVKAEEFIKTYPQRGVPADKAVNELPLTMIQSCEKQIVIPVNAFVRKLPEGYKASNNQKMKAEALGIVLMPDETFVEAHTRSRVA